MALPARYPDNSGPGGALCTGWGHVASADLVRWLRLSNALSCGPEDWDARGAWDGSLTLLESGPLRGTRGEASRGIPQRVALKFLLTLKC